jgi:hypothetical protein
MIAALYVAKNGCYYGLPDVDPWPEERDARLYAGPWPVVAHPPCSRWCRLAGLVEARWGHTKGDDGGTFAAALASVRTWGGVLEHPAFSAAFAAHGLTAPAGAWQRSIDGGWVCHVEQWHYGHAAKKATWLYYFGSAAPPSMRWGRTPDNASPALVERWSSRPRALVSWCGNHTKAGDVRERLGKKAAAATPLAFRDLLLSIARSVPK